MELKDNRTDKEKVTHNYLIIMTDSVMSGWGGAKGGKSYAAWACTPEDREKVYTWVKSRSDAKKK
jgi:hypothetical protein